MWNGQNMSKHSFLIYGHPSHELEILKKRVPGLVNIQKAIEHGPVEIVDLPIKHGGFFHSFL